MNKKKFRQIKRILHQLLTGQGLLQTITIVLIYAALAGLFVSSQKNFNQQAIAGCSTFRDCNQDQVCYQKECKPEGTGGCFRGCCSGDCGGCGNWEECDIQNGQCSSGLSCRSKQGCSKDSDCGWPQKPFRCVNGNCQKNDGTGTGSIQCIADKNGVRTWYSPSSENDNASFNVQIKYVLCRREFPRTPQDKSRCFKNPFCGDSPSQTETTLSKDHSWSHGFTIPVCGPWQTDIEVYSNGKLVCKRSDHSCSWNDQKCTSPTPTFTPTPTSTTPTPTPTPTPTGTLTPTPSPIPTTTSTPTPTPTGTLTPTSTPTPEEELKKCYQECEFDEDCEGEWFCEEVSGIKRCINIDCPEEPDCYCPEEEPTPTKAGVIKGEVVTTYPPTGSNTYLALTLVSGAIVATLLRVLLLFI